MFTNLDFLAVGKTWVPTNSTYQDRQENYIDGRRLYEGQYELVFSDVWQKMASRYGLNYGEIEQVMVKVNLFRTLTETFKTLIFDKMPTVNIEEDDYDHKELVNIMKQSFISAHAQGEGVFKVYSKTNGDYAIGSVNPELWIPVYNPDNLNEVMYHVVGHTYEVENDTSTIFNAFTDAVTKYLYVEVHEKGKYEKRTYELDSQDVIERLIDSEEVTVNGWDDFLVFPFNFGRPNWRDYGISQYEDVIPLVDELVVRLSNNSKILDDHADPQLIVPNESLEFDPVSGERVYKRHQSLTVDRDGNKPEYLTWDGNLDNAEKQMDRIMALYYMITRTNPQIYGQDIAGNLSGDALSKIMMMPIAAAKEMAQPLGETVEKALECYMALSNKSADDVTVEFEIGSFNTVEDVSNRMQNEVRAGISSIERAIRKANPRYDDEQVQSELDLIATDRQGSGVNITDILGA